MDAAERAVVIKAMNRSFLVEQYNKVKDLMGKTLPMSSDDDQDWYFALGWALGRYINVDEAQTFASQVEGDGR